MTRRRLLIITIILLAVVAVVVPFWWETWLWVAYEEGTKYGLTYFEKRRVWLPGDAVWLPDQVCHKCQSSGPHNHNILYVDDNLDGVILAQLLFPVPTESGADVYLGITDAEMPRLRERAARCLCPTCFPERAK